MSQDGFRFRSGRLCLDFAATLGGRHRGGIERLATPDDLARWLRLAVPVRGEIPVTGEILTTAREMREAVYRLVHPASRNHPDPADVATVNLWAARPVFAPELGPDGRVVTLRAERMAQAGLATVARDVVELLSGPSLGRVRECGRPDCSLLFVDESRPGQRRWCDMKSCGNRAKARQYRLSHSAAR